MYRLGNCWLFIIIAVFAALFSACTNDLKKIQEISQKAVNSPADTTRGVDIIYSDSAHVKVRILAPLMLEYNPDEVPPIGSAAANKVINSSNTPDNTSRKVMPKGIKIIIYDKNLQEKATIVADTAYYLETQKMIKLRKNVVLTSAKGDVLKSEELNWDQYHHTITSNKPVDITSANGDVGHGTGLETNESGYPLSIKNLTGTLLSVPNMSSEQ